MRRSSLTALVSAATLAIFGLTVAPVSAVTPTTLVVTTTSDVDNLPGPCHTSSTATPSPLSLRDAVCLANNLGTATPVVIDVPGGTYSLNASLGELDLGTATGQDATIAGTGPGATVIDAGGHSRVLNIDPASLGGVTAALQNLTITGGADSTFGGAGILAGSAGSSPDALTLSGVTVTGNNVGAASPSATNVPGGGLQFIGGQLSITNSTFSNNTTQSSPGGAIAYQAMGVGTESFTMTGTTISNNTSTNHATALDVVDGAVQLSSPSNSIPLSISGSTFTGNTATGANGPTRGAALTLESGGLSVTGSTFTGNTITGASSRGAAIAVVDGAATLHNNRIVDNVAPAASQGSGLALVGAGSANATDNWWGCNAGPGSTGCDTTAGSPTVSPRLVLSGTAVTTTVGSTTPVSANLTHDSSSAAVTGPFPALDGVSMTFTNPLPAGASCAPGSVNLSGGTASGACTFNPNGASGVGQVTVSVDHQAIAVPVTVNAPPSITASPTDQTVAAGGTATFSASADGYPAPTVQWQVSTDGGSTFSNISGATSSPLTFTVSASQNQNRYRAVFTNTVTSATTTAATLAVQQPPAFTSGTTANFTAGTNGTFPITTSGLPAPSSIAASGSLASGLTFTNNGDGTASISGTPASGTGGVYSLQLTAANGVSPDASQTLSVIVSESPTITTNPSDATVAPATSATFTAAANGYPVPTVQWQVSTDGGATFTNIVGATSTSYTLTANAGLDGTKYRAVFTNTLGSATTTAATLSVRAAPTFTSANASTFTVGTAGSFAITTSGIPHPTITKTGVLPTGVTLADNGDGTATLAGTPATGSGGVYTFTLHAANGVTPAGSQTFTLTVKGAPHISSPATTTFQSGVAGTFTVTTDRGYPTPALAVTAGLPTGLSFTDNGDGTATISGTTTAVGTVNVTITATNSAGTVQQPLTVNVTQPAAITSASTTTFTTGSAGTFTVTSTGYPTAALTETGPLPTGVTFVDNGDGTATLAGTPAAGTGGSYPLTLKAHNGVGTDATQSFVLTVDQAPAITSATTVTFGAAVAAAPFTVTTSGFPAPSLVETGTLPPGVTFVDNGDGTGTLSGTPAAGSAGNYPITFNATNVVNSAVQPFTLVVAVAPQSISFTSTPPAAPVVGQTYTVSATGGPSGNAVAFAIDGASSGVCTITGSQVTFTHPGSCVIDAHQNGNGQYAAADNSQATTVAKAATSTAVAVTAHAVTATMSVLAPGSGTPTGTVTFAVNGTPVGTATVTGGVATLNYTVPTGQTQNVAAAYSGDSDFSPSSASTARQDPSITATVSSSVARSSYGWYRVPVRVSFSCLTHGAPLTAACPSPVTLSSNGAGQSVSRTIMATNGGAATASVNGINIDRKPPTVTITGVTNGAYYPGAAPRAHCVAHDPLSGVASCRLTSKASGTSVTVTARATDRAGNVSTTHRTYYVLRIFILGATMKNGAYTLKEGQSFTIVALTSGTSRPRYYDAVPFGQTPRPADNYFTPAGMQYGLHRYTIGVRLEHGFGRYYYWVFGVKIGKTLHTVKFHPIR